MCGLSENITKHTHVHVQTHSHNIHMYLLDITKQRCCIEWFVSSLYNYVHFPVVNYIHVDIQQISCSAQTGAAFALVGLMLSCLGTATTIYITNLNLRASTLYTMYTCTAHAARCGLETS